MESLEDKTQIRFLKLAQEKGFSTWLTVVLVSDHGFHLNKHKFRDAIHLRYGWLIMDAPQTCGCGTPFDINHALICKKRGFPIRRHNEIRDITASLLSKVCHNVSIEPSLLPLTGEQLTLKSSVTSAEAHLDIKARGFWNPLQDVFFDVCVSHPNAPSYINTSLPQLYHQHESEKKREYN